MSIVDVVLKSSVLLLLGALAANFFARRSAAAHRHFIWTLLMTGLLALPALSALLPWRLPILPAVPSGPAVGTTAAARQQFPAAEAAAGPAVAEATPLASAGVTSMQPQAAQPRSEPRLQPRDAALLLWIAGLIVIGLRLLLSIAALLRLLRGAREITDPAFQLALARAADQLAVRAPVRLLESPRATIPMTFGLRRAVIVLPPEARDWPAELRDVVLLHEVAHIRRGDAQGNIISQLVCAFYWFHPLVWGAARRMRIEAERACDDLVLRAGAPPSAYAAHLLSMVQAVATSRAPAFAVPLAQRSAFEGRVLAILEPGLARHDLTARAVAVGVAALCAVAVPLAALAPASVQQEPDHVRRSVERHVNRPSVQRNVERAVARATSRVEVKGVDVGYSRNVNIDLSRSAARQDLGGAVAALVIGLGDEAESVREASAHALGDLGAVQDTAAINALVAALRRDTSREVRKTAAWALGQIEDKRAVPGLLASLRDERDPEVRTQVVWALGQTEAEEAVDGLGAALRTETASEIRHMIVWALGQIENRAAVPYLIPVLRDSDPELREKAAWALGQVESGDAVDGLVAAFSAERVAKVREQIIWALGQIEDRRAAPALEVALRDSSLEVRRKAAWAFAQLDELPEAPAGLIAAAHDPDLEVRRDVVRALGEIRGSNAIEALVALMRDPDPEIRRLAAHALGNR